MPQGGELLIILLVALVVLGPTRLPGLARKAGQYASELRKAARELRSGLEAEVEELKGASDEIRAMRDEIKRPFDDVQKGIEEVGVSRLEWTGPKPLSGPTPADAMADLERLDGGDPDDPDDPDEHGLPQGEDEEE